MEVCFASAASSHTFDAFYPTFFVFINNRSLTSVLSDLPDASNGCYHETDFMEGMKAIFDAMHPDVDEETIPTYLIPRAKMTTIRLVL